MTVPKLSKTDIESQELFQKRTTSKFTRILSIDEVVTLLNPFGFYQWITILQFMVNQLAAFIIMGFLPFAGMTPKWSCSVNNTAEFGQDCEVFQNCAPENLTFEYDFYPITVEWQLVCERNVYVNVIASLQQISLLIGFTITGYISDRWGRKWPSVAIMALQACIGVAASFASSWQMLAAFMFLLGITLGAKAVVIWPFTAETVTNRERYLLRSIASAAFLMLSMQTGVAYLTAHWRRYLFYGSLITLPGVLLLIFMSESPRWLLQKEKVDKSTRIIERIARINRNSEKLPQEFNLEPVKAKKSSFCVLDIFRSGRTLLIFSLLYAFAEFAIKGGGIGMWHNLGNLESASENIYLSNFLTSPLTLISIPIAIVEAKFSHKVNRRRLFIFLPILVAFASFGIVVVSSLDLEDSWANTALAAIGVSANHLCNDILALIVVELFPTVMRSSAASFGGFVSSLSCTAAPHVLSLRFYWSAAPYLIFGVMFLLLSLFAYFAMPDTSRMELGEIENLVAVSNAAESKMCKSFWSPITHKNPLSCAQQGTVGNFLLDDNDSSQGQSLEV